MEQPADEALAACQQEQLKASSRVLQVNDGIGGMPVLVKRPHADVLRGSLPAQNSQLGLHNKYVIYVIRHSAHGAVSMTTAHKGMLGWDHNILASPYFLALLPVAQHAPQHIESHPGKSRSTSPLPCCTWRGAVLNQELSADLGMQLSW